ncbi:MAG: HAD family hydrolase [Planctomycetaceae bacterium]
MDVCLFDIDGTLLSTGGAGQAAMEAAIAMAFGTERRVSDVLTAGRTDHAISLDLFQYYGVEMTEERGRNFRDAYLEQLPRFLSDRAGTVLPGVERLLDSLAEQPAVALGLLTGNFREGAAIKLRHYALEHFFAFGGFGDRHLDRDDVAREALRECRRHLGTAVDPQRVWVIGDTPSDIRCARAIGARSVAVATGVFPPADLAAARPDHLFSDFSEPESLLQVLA